MSSSTVKKEHRMVLTSICPKQDCSVFLLLGLPLTVKGTRLKSVLLTPQSLSSFLCFIHQTHFWHFLLVLTIRLVKDTGWVRFNFAMQTTRLFRICKLKLVESNLPCAELPNPARHCIVAIALICLNILFSQCRSCEDTSEI